MANGKYVAYYRQSTSKQEKSGLGIDAQKKAVEDYLNGGKWEVLASFTETESGKRSDRPELARALAMCRIHNATLVVAKLDRLARNTRFLLTVRDETGDSGVVFCDYPIVPEGAMGKYFITNMAALAELECGLVGQRTKAALQAAKKRGKVLGCRNDNIAVYASQGAKASASARSAKAAKRATDFIKIIERIKAEGATSLHQIATKLNDEKFPAARGGKWSAIQVQRVMSTKKA
jgi:DNA invertase Pin-like site-specific DNA recombinase